MDRLIPQVKPIRAYAPDEKAEKRLLAAGVKASAIYRADKGETLGRFKMYPGEYLGVVDGLRAFGKGRVAHKKAVKLIHAQGATIIDVETRKDSREHGVEMQNDALDPPKPSPELMRALQEASVDSRIKGRMLKRDALVEWTTHPKLSCEEVIMLMPGWTVSTAYNQLKKRNIPAGRRPNVTN